MKEIIQHKPQWMIDRDALRKQRLSKMIIDDNDPNDLADQIMAKMYKPIKVSKSGAGLYCSREFEDRLKKQFDVYQKHGKARRNPMLGFLEMQVRHGLEVPNVAEFERMTICDQCNRPVQRIEVEMYTLNRWYKFNVYCHGKVESYEITEIEYAFVKFNRVRAYCFIDPAKQEARDWIDYVLSKRPEHLLLTEQEPEYLIGVDMAFEREELTSMKICPETGVVFHTPIDPPIVLPETRGMPDWDKIEAYNMVYGNRKQRWWRKWWSKLFGKETK